MTIRLLPPDVTGKIAAGEVIERPASVVKELVENGLDAGARSISVEILAGGRELIRVFDDGAGIPADELPLALQRHATSKLRTADDLNSIRTLGFRGEALASMAAIAQLTIASVARGAGSGRRLTVLGNEVLEDQVYGGPSGTEVNVRGLFRTVPARLEFLKSDRTESFHVLNVAQHLATAHPEVRFALSIEGRPSFNSPGTRSRRDALLAIFGAELLDSLVEIEPGKFNGVEGFVSQPGRDRSNRSHIAFYVNGRWVSSPTLSKALAEAYRGLLPAGRHPAAYLHLSIPPEEIDINVHPAKAEVRFRDGGQVFYRLSTAIRRTLVERSEFVPVALGSDRPVVDSFFIPTRFTQQLEPAPPPAIHLQAPQGLSPRASAPMGEITSPKMRALGQIDRTYVVAAGPDGLYLIDQHTAHERVLYEELAKNDQSHARQQVLAPEPVELAGSASAWLEENAAAVTSMGLEAEPFGGTTWIVRSVPAIAAGREAGAFLREVAGEMAADAGRHANAGDRLCWSMACKSAVKAGDALAVPEMQALIDQLLKCDLGRTCPHGRPTTLRLSREMLDRQFGRA